jgi:hypothetical protein
VSAEGAPTGGPSGLGIERTALLLGAYAWVEGRLFSVLGAWAAEEGDHSAVVLLDALSRQHAWHASLFTECLPKVPALAASSLAESPAAPAPSTAEVLDRLAVVGDSVERMAGLARVVLPRLVTGYRRHLATARSMSDAPVVRALRLVVRDEVEALVETEEALEALMAGRGSPSAALARAADLEEPLAGAGPGLVPWPEGSGGSVGASAGQGT